MANERLIKAADTYARAQERVRLAKQARSKAEKDVDKAQAEFAAASNEEYNALEELKQAASE